VTGARRARELVLDDPRATGSARARICAVAVADVVAGDIFARMHSIFPFYPALAAAVSRTLPATRTDVVVNAR
jgi:hypothetical protein